YSRTDPVNLQQIEVYNGANSVFNGSGSVGGTINLVSKEPRTEALTIAQGLTGTGASAGGGGGGGGSNASRILSPRGSVIAESRTNQLFVSDVPTRLAQVAELIQKLDIPVRQVLIEARIVEASDTFGKSLGVKLGGGAVNSRTSFGTYPNVTGGGTTTTTTNGVSTSTSTSPTVTFP
ncbi:hypothetical protein CVH10_17075, partial [Halomonas sp. ND22Bw]|uniref:secretin N-terminal domain-containing protein n=1 Tax=Halomonas sp. ND22Bw TaxID=2054178 RepID=UPI000D293DFC